MYLKSIAPFCCVEDVVDVVSYKQVSVDTFVSQLSCRVRLLRTPLMS